MASASSSTYENRWVRQGLSSIEAKIEVEATPSIFLVTKELKEETKSSEAYYYTPQKLGLGAYHHLSPHLHVADRQKHALVKELIHHNRLPNFSLNNFLEEMKDLEPVIRSNYDNYLDLEPPTLAYIMAIDSLYLLAFLQCYHQKSVQLVHKTLAKDVLKLENQIPAPALTLAGNQLGLFLDNDYYFSSSSRRRRSRFNGDTKLYAEFFYDFCRAVSPLKLAELRENLRKQSKHLLAHLYYLIVNNQGLKDEDEDDDDEAMPEFLPLKYPDSSVIFLPEASPTVIISSIDVSLDSYCSAVAAVEITPTMNQCIENGEFESHRSYDQNMDAGSFDVAEPVIEPYRQLNQGLKDEDEDDDDKAMPEFPPLKNPDSVIVVTEDSSMLINSSIDDSLDSNCSDLAAVEITPRMIEAKETETCCRSLDVTETVIKPFQTVTTILQVWKDSSFANYIFKQEEEKPKIEEIQIPSASELSEKFNVDFKPTEGGIRGIKFQSAEEGKSEANTLYLPEIKLENDSEAVLRNLVAYEAALFAAHSSGSKLELTDYVDLMCGIVDTTEDVKLLRKKGIIEEGGLSDEKIAEMFNGINRSSGGGQSEEEEKSESQMAVEKVNKMVEDMESKMMWTRANKFCNKIVKSTRELLLKKPAIMAIKYLTYIFLAALLLLQILQAYCDVYDCSRRESQTTNVATRLMSVI